MLAMTLKEIQEICDNFTNSPRSQRDASLIARIFRAVQDNKLGDYERFTAITRNLSKIEPETRKLIFDLLRHACCSNEAAE